MLGEREGVFVDLEEGKKVAWLFKPVRGDRRARARSRVCRAAVD